MAQLGPLAERFSQAASGQRPGCSHFKAQLKKSLFQACSSGCKKVLFSSGLSDWRAQSLTGCWLEAALGFLLHGPCQGEAPRVTAGFLQM